MGYFYPLIIVGLFNHLQRLRFFFGANLHLLPQPWQQKYT